MDLSMLEGVSHGSNVDNKIEKYAKKVKKASSLAIPAFAGTSFLSTIDYYTRISGNFCGP